MRVFRLAIVTVFLVASAAQADRGVDASSGAPLVSVVPPPFGAGSAATAAHLNCSAPQSDVTPPAPVIFRQDGTAVPKLLSLWAKCILAIHNSERLSAGVPPLRWNLSLQSSASEQALRLARTGQLTHAPREGRGIERENVLEVPIGASPGRMLKLWTDEKRNFFPGVFPNVARTGNWMDIAHYTQMIWPKTTDLGCATSPGFGASWLVCRYSPGGNKDGKPVGKPTETVMPRALPHGPPAAGPPAAPPASIAMDRQARPNPSAKDQ